MSWKISDVKLPPGFSLGEDATFVYLYYKGDKVANFSSQGTNPVAIQRAAEGYLKKIQR